MDKIIEFYLNGGKFKHLVIMQLFFDLNIFLITNKICLFIGIAKDIPKDINLANVLLYITSGNIILPILIFFSSSYIIHGFKQGYLFLRYQFGSGKNKYNDHKILIKTFEALCYISEENGIIYKGSKFYEFEEIVDGFNDKNKMDISYYTSFLNSIFIGLFITLLMYFNWVNLVFMIIDSILFFFTFNNIEFLWSLRDNKEFLSEIINEAKVKI